MKTVSILRKSWVKACAMAICLYGVVPAIDAQSLQAQAEFEVGDKWTYRHHNKGDLKQAYVIANQAYKSDADSGWLYEETQDPNAKRKKAIWRYDYKRGSRTEAFAFQPLGPSQPGEMYFDGKPYEDFMQFPLVVGRKYAVHRDNVAKNGYTKYDAEVEALEKVKTEAGEFDAYRIKLTGWWTRTDLMEAGRPLTGRAEIVIHFAPSVKKYVKWEERSWRNKGASWTDYEIELTKWEPKAELPANFLNVTKSAAQ